MSIHYIIDGYNVIKQVRHLADLKLKNGRDSFIQILKKHRPQGSLKNKVTVVYDGNSDVCLPYNNSHTKSDSNIGIIFSENESADDKIKKIAAKAQNPKILVVVTDDKEIQYFVKRCGAKVVSVKEFLTPISHKKKQTNKPLRDKPKLSDEESTQITEELQHIWLNDK